MMISLFFQTGLFVDFFVWLFTQLKFSLVGQCIFSAQCCFVFWFVSFCAICWVESLTCCLAVEECSENGCLALSLLELLALNMMFIFISSVLVLIEVRTSEYMLKRVKSLETNLVLNSSSNNNNNKNCSLIYLIFLLSL